MARARVEPNVGPLLERDEPDAIELALEKPVGAREALLGERSSHRLDPIGERRARHLGGVHTAGLRHAMWTSRARRPFPGSPGRLRPPAGPGCNPATCRAVREGTRSEPPSGG